MQNGKSRLRVKTMHLSLFSIESELGIVSNNFSQEISSTMCSFIVTRHFHS